MTDSLKNIVVVGLGPAAAALINVLEPSLPPTHRIVAIGKDPFGYHTVGALRGAVVPGWEELIPVPLEKILTSNRNVLLSGTTVTKLGPTSVRVDKANTDKGFDTEIPFDILVLALGSTYPVPCRPPADAKTADDVQKALKALQTELKGAKSILVIGGGAVGIEYAAEAAFAYPDKKVTLVHAHSWLHNPHWKSGFHSSVASQLKALNIDLNLDTRLDFKGEKSGKISPQTFDLGNGKTVEADFVLLARGNQFNGKLASQLSPDLVTDKGQIKVKPTLQVDSKDAALARIFAIGDCTAPLNEKEAKTYYNAKQQAAVLAKNIVAVAKGGSTKDWAPPGPGGLVAITPNGGVLQLFGLVLGSWAVKRIKSATLFTPMVYADYHATPPKTYNNKIPA